VDGREVAFSSGWLIILLTVARIGVEGGELATGMLGAAAGAGFSGAASNDSEVPLRTEDVRCRSRSW
jgi:hypothetical protein